MPSREARKPTQSLDDVPLLREYLQAPVLIVCVFVVVSIGVRSGLKRKFAILYRLVILVRSEGGGGITASRHVVYRQGEHKNWHSRRARARLATSQQGAQEPARL